MKNSSQLHPFNFQLLALTEAIERLDYWLERPPVIQSGARFPVEACGAVAGVVDGDKARYWYGEIAGYYLRYAASRLVETPTRRLKKLVHSVVSGLAADWNEQVPLTRRYRRPTSDWRNDLVFSFDLSMMLHGLAAVGRLGIDPSPGVKIALFIKRSLVDQFGRLRATAFRKSHCPGASDRESPAQWSVKYDGHLLKAAAAIMDFGLLVGDQDLIGIAKATIDDLTASNDQEWSHLPVHPRCYAQEGLLLCGVASPTQLRSVHWQQQRVFVPESARTDEIAQMLRLALIVGSREQNAQFFIQELLGRIQSNGAVVFSRKTPATEGNVWSAIFARQALSWAITVNRGGAINIDELV